MLTRRSMLTTAGFLGVSMVASRRVSGCSPNPKTIVNFEVPNFEVPHGACDTHVHVIGEPTKFPMSPQRDYTPPSATVDELAEALKFLNLDRVVVVTPTIYGSDNSATVAAVRQLGRDRARGVALIDENTSPRILDALVEAQISGIRLFLHRAGALDRAAAANRLRRGINLADRRGWHLQISTPPDIIAALAMQLASSPVPLVLDCFGWIAGGVHQSGFDTVLSLVKSGRAYVKLAEPYRLSSQTPDYLDLLPVIKALLAANPDGVIWGSGWPHVDSTTVAGRRKTDLAPNLPVDTGHLLNLLARSVPDARLRRKILVDNPARLYSF